MDLLFAGVAVSGFEDAVSWYAQFFGRAADVDVNDHEVMWRVVESGWLYVIEDTKRAGMSLVSIAVSDLDQAVTELEGRGIRSEAIESIGDAARKARFTDTDGNSIALIQINQP